jgi:hypothetical protein
MSGKNDVYCDACIEALMLANVSLTQLSVSALLKRTPYGKSDTYAFDAISEIQIKGCLARFDPDSVLVTEELGQNFLDFWPNFSDIAFHPSVFFCDPTDRSSSLVKFLESFVRDNRGAEKFGTVISDKDAITRWEEMAKGPASITGSVAAITCVRRGRIVFSVVLNYITQEITIACSSGIVVIKLDGGDTLKRHRLTLADAIKRGHPIDFNPIAADSPWDDSKYFTTFMGSAGKTGYAQNIEDSDILSEKEREQFIRHREPGGPARILYLSSLQSASEPMGFILANGEKITEWIHWISFVRFARHGDKRALRLFEISQARPWTKEGILMGTSSIYSVFHSFDGIVALDVNFLRRFPNPSRYRSTLIVAPFNNEWVNHLMQQLCYREIIID